jgi:tRNA pseudouridine55 synthase
VTASRQELEALLQKFVGRIAQVPPRHSALKRDGRKYYEYARAGVEIARHAREVEIRELELLSWRSPDLELRVRCGKGTYIRVLAEDIGASRTGSGGFALAEAITLDDLQQRPEAARDAALLPVDALVAGLARLDLEDNDAIRLAQGQAVVRAGLADGVVRVYTAGGFAGVASVVGGIVRARRLVAQTPSIPSRD